MKYHIQDFYISLGTEFGHIKKSPKGMICDY